MSLSINKNASHGKLSGIAILDDCLRFVELDSQGNTLRQEHIPLPDGCIVNESIHDFERLSSAFTQLHERVGKLSEPPIVGLPAGDVIIRPINLPSMSLDDLRGTVDLNFDEYFPYSRDAAVFDIIRITTPADLRGSDDVTVLAVSAKTELVEKLLDTARQAGIPAGAVEPLNFAMLRGVPEADEGLSIFVSPHNLAAVFNGEGIFFRKANNREGTQDILNTMQFIETTYRNVRVSKLILYGLNFQLRSDSAIEVINLGDEFLTARGLALRDVLDKPKLDLRPGAYVELERRRYSFNPNRLAFWVLLCAFLVSTIGTMAFSWVRILELDAELEGKRITNSELLARRAELARGNADLEAQQKRTQKVLDFLRKDMPVLEVMGALETRYSAGVKFSEATFSRQSLGGITVTIDGRADDEKAVLAMTDGLKSTGLFDEVKLPISLKAMGKVVFKLLLRVKDVGK